ncbi:hypothetical protein [Altererythrobacter fulvus]|uniref:hypothetical protein n=1 Tax=Caenibius fulvus TaxID=2126012 RepID=UPI0030160545
MKRVKVFAAAVAAFAAVAGPHVVSAQSASDEATLVTQGLQQLVGSDYGGGLTVSAISSEGAVVVLTMDGPANWREGISAAEISYALLTGLCSTAPQFFDGGVQLRVDSTEVNANRIAGPIETSCPPPE